MLNSQLQLSGSAINSRQQAVTFKIICIYFDRRIQKLAELGHQLFKSALNKTPRHALTKGAGFPGIGLCIVWIRRNRRIKHFQRQFI